MGYPFRRGETISRFRDDPQNIADGLDALCDLIGRSFFAVGALVVMWQINPMLTAVLFVPLLLSTFLTEALGSKTIAYRAASRAATGRLTGFLGELLRAQLAVKVAGGAPHAVARLSELGDARRRLAVRDSVFEQMLNAFSINIAHLGTGVVLLLGAHAIADGTFSVGDLALFVVYLDQLGWYPAEIGRLISDLKRIDVSYGRMREVVPGEPPAALVERAPASFRSPPPRERLERLERACARATRIQAARAASSTSRSPLERGSFTVITGRIGAGKTTLLHVLLGLLPHDGGEIWWNGRPIEDPSSFFVPPRSAFTPQVPRLFSESLRENILLGRNDDTGRTRRGHPRGGARARCGGAAARARYAGRAAWGEAFGRPGPARRRGAHVCTRRRAARVRRSFVGARRRNRGRAVGAALRPRSRRDLPGRLAPPGCAPDGPTRCWSWTRGVCSHLRHGSGIVAATKGRAQWRLLGANPE